jgi:hypothetical protein
MSNVTAMPGVHTDLPADAQPDIDVIDLCRKMLAKAESGELREIAVITVNGKGYCGEGWAPYDQFSHYLAAGVGDLFFRCHMARNEVSRPVEDEQT